MQFDKKVVKRIISFAVFISIIGLLFINVTWLFRDNMIESRQDIYGFTNEKNIDVVLYGGSNLLRFYQPMMAWNEAGFTSYNYATSSAKVDVLKNYCEESRKNNEAKLYVFDIRTLTFGDQIADLDIRNWSDSISPLSWNRFDGVSDYIFSKSEWKETDIPSFYLDIIKYHGQHELLGEEEQWRFLSRTNIINRDKGFDPLVTHFICDKPSVYDGKKELSSSQINKLHELLEYCKKEELNALFIVCPFQISESEWEILNSAGEYIEEQGYSFVNFNRYYDEIGIDFSTDFADINHLNYVGSEKYTRFLIDYLSNNYDLADHRGDSTFSDWDEWHNIYQVDADNWKRVTQDCIYKHMQSISEGANLRQIDDFSNWYEKIKTQKNNYTVFVVKKMPLEWTVADFAFNSFLSDFEITLDNDSYCGAKQDVDWVVEPCADDSEHEGMVGFEGGKPLVKYYVQAGDKAHIMLNDVEYSLDNGNGINVVVFNNNDYNVIDSVSVVYEDGKMLLKR